MHDATGEQEPEVDIVNSFDPLLVPHDTQYYACPEMGKVVEESYIKPSVGCNYKVDELIGVCLFYQFLQSLLESSNK